MVAYSFKERFVAPILAGTKRQTIRADRRRHARPDEVVQLYTGMRTRHCKLIGQAPCIVARPVHLCFGIFPENGYALVNPTHIYQTARDMKAFAIADGFADWLELRAFWEKEHPEAVKAGGFDGVIIIWGDLFTGGRADNDKAGVDSGGVAGD